MTKGFVVPAGGGKTYEDTPGRVFALKLAAGQTGESIMLFEETVPAGTGSTHHLHYDSDEVVWVLEGEFTFKIGDELFSGGPGTCAFLPRKVPHAWKSNGPGTGRAVFLYTPGRTGRFIEERFERGQPLSDAERASALERYRWEVIGPNPL
ncbi:MAG: cupin domain-containing protein [Proteobacteria bacterium]|nr:cupin domain-containing protein [Pseudomonadota bacterium]